MQFTKQVYKTAIKRALNEVYSRADILQWSKDHRDDSLLASVLEDEARVEYFRAETLYAGLVARAQREGKIR